MAPGVTIGEFFSPSINRPRSIEPSGLMAFCNAPAAARRPLNSSSELICPNAESARSGSLIRLDEGSGGAGGWGYNAEASGTLRRLSAIVRFHHAGQRLLVHVGI